MTVFLCHCSSDKPVVRNLYQRLTADGFQAWLDEADLVPGQDWEHEIRTVVHRSAAVVVCISQKSVNKSGFLQKEIKYVLDAADEQPEGTIFVIPLRLEECEVPLQLSKWHWVNYFEPSGYEKLQHALHERVSHVSASSFGPSVGAVATPTAQPNVTSNTPFAAAVQQPIPRQHQPAIINRVSHSRWAKWIPVVSLCFLIIACLWFWIAMRPVRALVEHSLNTEPGRITQVAISPDAQYVAYVISKNGKETLWLHQNEPAEEIEQQEPSNDTYIGITFGNDRHIYAALQNGRSGNLYRIPLFGKEKTLWVTNIDSGITFSPDGKRIAFIRENQKKTYIVVRNIEREGKETTIDSPGISSWYHYAPLWSLDGSRLLCLVYHGTSNRLVDFYSVPAEGGTPRVIKPDSSAQKYLWEYAGKPVWISPGDDLAAAVFDISSNRGRLIQMRTAWPSGRVSDLALDTANYIDLDSTPHGETFVAITSDRVSNISTVKLHSSQSQEIVPNSPERLDNIAWIRDSYSQYGKIIVQKENRALLMVDPKTHQSRSLTADTDIGFNPAISPDGKYLVYSGYTKNPMRLFRSELDGSHPIPLTSDDAVETQAVITPDSQWVIYTSLHGGDYGLWKVSIQGGNPQLILRQARNPSVSMDGAWVACEYFDDDKGWMAAIISSSGTNIHTFPNIPAMNTHPWIRWTHDSKNLLYVKAIDDASNIWLQPIDGGPSQQLTRFNDEVFDFAVSPDGDSVACIRGVHKYQIVLAQTTK